MADLPHIYDLTLTQLTDLLKDWKQPAFRARQIYRQVFHNHIQHPQAMTDLPLALRERLAQELRWQALEHVRLQEDDQGATRKALFRLATGEVVESVLMRYPGRATVCVSTQAGCAMGCTFCATGRLGLLRNLSPGQIVEQVIWAVHELTHTPTPGTAHAAASHDSRWWEPDARMTANLPLGNHLTNIVFMGMGEPFANYDRWWAAVEQLHEPHGFNMSARAMTVSTVGLPQGIGRLAAERLPINLAISLHAPTDELRSSMMPVNQRFPISELMEATRSYVAQTNRRVSFEYVLLQRQNDEPEHARQLAALLRGQAQVGRHVELPLQLVHVNLIPWNPVPGVPLGRSDMARVRAFQAILHEHGIACTVRVERGIAIAAACGQLAGSPASLDGQQIPVRI